MNAEAKTVAAAARPKLTDELAVLKTEIEKVLPAHVTPEKFMRVVLTAISQNPELYRADRRSLLTSAINAAQDGLLPDGREAAFVIFRTKERVTDASSGRDVERERARLALLAAALRAEREAISERLAHAPEHTGAAA